VPEQGSKADTDLGRRTLRSKLKSEFAKRAGWVGTRKIVKKGKFDG
jgi:hypothetical protein